PQADAWLDSAARGWDLVPVVIQDPIWEQSFPRIDSVVVPIADPRGGAVQPVRLTRREVSERRSRNEARLGRLLAELASLDLAPVQQLSPTLVTRTELGRLLTLSYDVSAACLDDRCLARREPRRLRLAPVTVTVPRRAGGTARMDAAWPVLDVRGRVAAVDLAPTNPPLKSDVAPPSVDYRLSPSKLER